MTEPAVAASLVVAPDHPALPGHFPGDPIVPGVLLLAHVEAALAAAHGPLRVTGIPEAKFLAPVRPAETIAIAFPAVTAGEARFECRRGADLVARGRLRFRREGARHDDDGAG